MHTFISLLSDMAPSPDSFLSSSSLLIKCDSRALRQSATRLVGALTPIRAVGYGRPGSNQPLHGRLVAAGGAGVSGSSNQPQPGAAEEEGGGGGGPVGGLPAGCRVSKNGRRLETAWTSPAAIIFIS